MRSGLVRRLGLSALVLALGLGLLEAALRLRQTRKYGAAFTFYRTELHEPTGLLVPVAGDEAGPVRINSLGFRGPELDVPKPEGRVRLAFLGGSTTFCAEATSLGATWPALVTEGLARRFPGVSFDYVNGGAAGFHTAQSRLNLEHRVRPLEPDVVVVYHGTNDLTFDTRWRAEEQGLYDYSADRPSALSEWWLTWNLVEKNLKHLRRRGGESSAGRFELDAEACARDFRERLVGLVRSARESAPVVAVATFAHKVRRDQAPEVQREACSSSFYYMPYMQVDDLLDAFEAYNRAVAAAAEETGAVLIEGEERIPGDDVHFNDSVHLLDPGSRIMADRVLEVLAADASFLALVESRRSAESRGAAAHE